VKRQKQPAKPTAIITDSAKFTPRCPKCGAVISLQATVERFNEPYKWDFWGRAGERWQRCKGEAGGYQYIHFRTLFDGRFSERLAWIKPTPAPTTQEALL
jgi:hypothetical protein